MSAAAQYGAKLLANAYKHYRDVFLTITARAQHRFETRDWEGVRHDVVRRTRLFDTEIDLCLAQLKDQLGAQIISKSNWAALEKAYEEQVAGHGH